MYSKALWHHACLLVVMAGLVVATRAAALADEPTQTPEPAENQATAAPARNAALSYWQAFAAMPQLDEKQMDLVLSDAPPAGEASEAMLNASASALRLLHRGAKIAACTWDLPLEEGPDALLPHVQKARDLARLACFRARCRFAQGQAEEGIDDVLAVMTLARHTGAEPLLISVLVQFAIEQMAIETVASYLPELTPPQLDRLAAGIAALPRTGTIKQAIEGERKWMVGWLENTWQQAVADPQQGEVLKSLFSQDAALSKMIANLLVKPVLVKPMLNDLREKYDTMAKLMDLGEEEFGPAWSKFENTVYQSPNPLVRLLLPAVGAAREAGYRYQLRGLLLAAAIDVTCGGQAKLKAHIDPYGKGVPFGYRKLDHGFELSSQLLYDNQPVTLRIGPPATEKKKDE